MECKDGSGEKMYRVDLTEDQAQRLHDSRSITDAFAVLLEAAGADKLLRYLTTPHPRPPLQVTLPAKCEKVEFTIGFVEPTNTDRRIELGIDGNAAFALLGEDIQSGEAEFVTVEGDGWQAEYVASKKALRKLRERLGNLNHPYYFGKSHPYGS